jgi:transcriptional regulator with XRE-family HTH domain
MISAVIAILGMRSYSCCMLTPAQSRAARAFVQWSQSKLAQASNLSVGTIKEFELGRREPLINNLSAVRRALEGAGVEFIDGDRPGVRMRERADG